ncbi:MFS transporter [Ureibacillus chungkukjangi]|uniref:Putative MFS family arabinose efflux permease n=1 Tax=Ureibacillus chungkukjangi TaxID=1202712 RepID=A0A318TJU3_9BACL|nr:MFS transporter [Ureibacillus chungkukjangi]PYF04713.1 putative MFS family arabinose efflux permease [Ureibacillus chungkukjangi]
MKEKIWTKDFIFVCLSNFFVSLNFYILATAFPLYVKDILNGNEQQMGLAITIYSLGIVLIRPFSGQWVDRFGNKKMALLGLVVFLIASFCYFGAMGIIVFLIIRFLHGMAYALASTATTTIASSLIPVSRQGEGIGYFSMFMSLAMVIGPAFGLFLWKDKNITLLLVAACIISALSLLFACAMRVSSPKRSNTEVQITEPIKKKKMQFSDFIEIKALPIALLAFLLAFSYSSLSGFLASFTAEINQTQIASLFFVVFALMIVVFRPIVGKAFDKYKEHYLYYPAILLFGLGLILLSQSHSGKMVLFSALIMGIGYGTLFSCYQALTVKNSPIHRRGIATATFLLFFDLGYGIGSYFMGLIASIVNYSMMYQAAGIITLLSVFLYYVLHHRPQAKESIKKQDQHAI